MFERVVLLTSLGKTKAMVCSPGLILVQQETVEYKKIEMAKGATF